VISQLVKQTHEIMGSIKAKQTQIIKSINQSIKPLKKSSVNKASKQLKNPD
jgi:hypothetical protein